MPTEANQPGPQRTVPDSASLRVLVLVSWTRLSESMRSRVRFVREPVVTAIAAAASYLLSSLRIETR